VNVSLSNLSQLLGAINKANPNWTILHVAASKKDNLTQTTANIIAKLINNEKAQAALHGVNGSWPISKVVVKQAGHVLFVILRMPPTLLLSSRATISKFIAAMLVNLMLPLRLLKKLLRTSLTHQS
jgi:hypothetical protein